MNSWNSATFRQKLYGPHHIINSTPISISDSNNTEIIKLDQSSEENNGSPTSSEIRRPISWTCKRFKTQISNFKTPCSKDRVMNWMGNNLIDNLPDVGVEEEHSENENVLFRRDYKVNKVESKENGSSNGSIHHKIVSLCPSLDNSNVDEGESFTKENKVSVNSSKSPVHLNSYGKQNESSTIPSGPKNGEIHFSPSVECRKKELYNYLKLMNHADKKEVPFSQFRRSTRVKNLEERELAKKNKITVCTQNIDELSLEDNESDKILGNTDCSSDIVNSITLQSFDDLHMTVDTSKYPTLQNNQCKENIFNFVMPPHDVLDEFNDFQLWVDPILKKRKKYRIDQYQYKKKNGAIEAISDENSIKQGITNRCRNEFKDEDESASLRSALEQGTYSKSSGRKDAPAVEENLNFMKRKRNRSEKAIKLRISSRSGNGFEDEIDGSHGISPVQQEIDIEKSDMKNIPDIKQTSDLMKKKRHRSDKYINRRISRRSGIEIEDRVESSCKISPVKQETDFERSNLKNTQDIEEKSNLIKTKRIRSEKGIEPSTSTRAGNESEDKSSPDINPFKHNTNFESSDMKKKADFEMKSYPIARESNNSMDEVLSFVDKLNGHCEVLTENNIEVVAHGVNIRVDYSPFKTKTERDAFPNHSESGFDNGLQVMSKQEHLDFPGFDKKQFAMSQEILSRLKKYLSESISAFAKKSSEMSEKCNFVQIKNESSEISEKCNIRQIENESCEISEKCNQVQIENVSCNEFLKSNSEDFELNASERDMEESQSESSDSDSISSLESDDSCSSNSVSENECDSSNCDLINTNSITPRINQTLPFDESVETKTLHSFLKRCVKSSQHLNPINAVQDWDSDNSMCGKQKNGTSKSNSHFISFQEENGSVQSSIYINYHLILIQEFAVSIWNQTALGNVLGAQNLWIFNGCTKKLILNKECVRKKSLEMAISIESCVVYVELWTKEHKSDIRQGPVADVFATVYYWIQKMNKMDRKVLQLENITGFADDVQYVVLKSSLNIVVSWHSGIEESKRTHIRIYTLAGDFQTIVDVRALAEVEHYVSSLHNIEDCEELLMGCGEHTITLWNIEHGYIVASIELINIKLSLCTMWVKCDRGILFTLQQCVDGELRLIAINGRNHSWKKLKSYKPPDGFERIQNVYIENGVLISFYEEGILCWKAQTGEQILEENHNETDIEYLPTGKYLVILTKKNVFIRHALTHLLAVDD